MNSELNEMVLCRHLYLGIFAWKLKRDKIWNKELTVAEQDNMEVDSFMQSYL